MKIIPSLFLICSAILTGRPLQAAFIFDFEEGAFGTYWEVVSDDPSASVAFGFSDHPFYDFSGSFGLSSTPVTNRDDAHTLFHVRSASFTLDGTGGITFDITLGHSAVRAPALGTGDVFGGGDSNMMGITLTRVSDGERVLTRAADLQTLTAQNVGWTEAEVDPFAAEVGETWRLDVYEARNGIGGGTFALDNISVSGALISPAVPEPASMALLGMGSLCLLGLRRRRSR